jgi:hypothetical protein
MAGPPDPRQSLFIFASGKKGSGKSHLARAWFDSYPFDRMVIDPTNDVRTDLRADGVEFVDLDQDTLPVKFPASLDENKPYVTCVLAPDMGSATAVDDMDRAVGLCLRDRPTLLWCDEFGSLTTSHKTPPNTRRSLHHGRHHFLTLIIACPRPSQIDPLAISQSDLCYTFRTPNKYDRERIANEIGFNEAEFTAINNDLQLHWHTLYDARDDQLSVMPPLPPRSRGTNPYPPTIPA